MKLARRYRLCRSLSYWHGLGTRSTLHLSALASGSHMPQTHKLALPPAVGRLDVQPGRVGLVLTTQLWEAHKSMEPTCSHTRQGLSMHFMCGAGVRHCLVCTFTTLMSLGLAMSCALSACLAPLPSLVAQMPCVAHLVQVCYGVERCQSQPATCSVVHLTIMRCCFQ